MLQVGLELKTVRKLVMNKQRSNLSNKNTVLQVMNATATLFSTEQGLGFLSSESLGLREAKLTVV